MRLRVLMPMALLLPALAAPAAQAQGPAQRSQAAWDHRPGPPPASDNGARPDVRPKRFRAFKLDRPAMKSVLGEAPRERSASASASRPLTLSLPAPGGGFERFAVRESRILEPELAARHPEIATYTGTGIDDAGATVRVSLTALGLHASVRSPGGGWYIDPYYKGSESLYVTYRGEDLEDPHGGFVESEPVAPNDPAGPIAPLRELDGPAVSLRQYRLAFATDPSYAAYHGAANVTSAKAVLINRVNQLYEDDFGIRLVLVADNDRLNFNTASLMTGADGPCGARACFTSAQAASCTGATLDRNHTVLGQVIGAGNYDVGHIGMGNTGGGLAYLSVAGREWKGGGCTGVQTPVGDFFAVDYVAHELGHQFAGNHTFNGTAGSCSGNLAATSVEPGSGSSVMAYAGICEGDNLQPNSDPYFSQQTIAEVGDYTKAALGAIDEHQTVVLRGWGPGDSFKLTFAGQETTAIAHGSGYNRTAIANAIKALPAVTGDVQVYDLELVDSTPSPDGFVVRFVGGTDVPTLSVTSAVGTSGTVSETNRGGAAQNRGSTVTATANRAPVATVPAAAYTIPARTPFALTAVASDADGDALTYSWEQNDRGAGKALLDNTKRNGPLFRQFHTASKAAPYSTSYSPPGQNVSSATPTRVFPDMAQIVANNTNAVTGACPPGNVECFSEFLPTAVYLQPMNFRLVVRDGNPLAGGVGTVDTTVNVATAAGPFLVDTPATTTGGTSRRVTWAVANTNAAPVNAGSVRISLSTDGGLTFPTELAASTPNDGEHAVTIPNTPTSIARIKVEAVGNVFFDIADANFTITAAAVSAENDVGTASVQYSDAVTPVRTVTGSHTSADGATLSITAALPQGLALTLRSTSAAGVRPGTRAWELTGNVMAAPGSHPVTATVSDGIQAKDTPFTIDVTPEDAVFSGADLPPVTGAEGAATTAVQLRATVAGNDATPGDLTKTSVTFSKKDGTRLCTDDAADASGSAECQAQLPVGEHAFDIRAGGHYSGTGTGSVTVTEPPVFAASNDAPAGGASVQYSDPVRPAVTVAASDGTTEGAALMATPSGLPAGLSLEIASTSAAGTRPGTRTWRLAGTADGAPGTYPVSVQVADGDGHTTSTAFTVVVTRESARGAYTGETRKAAAAGETSAPVGLAATVEEVPDGSPGDLSHATVTFVEEGVPACSVLPVSAGAASCTASLGLGSHAMKVLIGGRYTGEAGGTVVVSEPAPAPTPTPAPTADPRPGLSVLPDLSRTASRLRVRRGRIKVKVTCRRSAPAAAGTCAGRLKLTAKIGGRRTRIAGRAFSIPAGATRTVTLKLSARGRAAIRRPLRARLAAGAARKSVTLRR